MRHGNPLALSVLVVAALTLPVEYARADVIYDFATGQTAYDVAPGGTVSVPVYLQETLTGGSSSQLVAQHGLFSFDVAVNASLSPSDPAVLLSAVANPQFDDSANTVLPSHVAASRDLIAHGLDPVGVPAVAVDATTYRILLATFTIEGGSVIGETTTFSVSNYENPLTPGGDENTFYWDDVTASNPLDATISPGSFTVTVVPEPASIALLGMCGLLALRRRKGLIARG